MGKKYIMYQPFIYVIYPFSIWNSVWQNCSQQKYIRSRLIFHDNLKQFGNANYSKTFGFFRLYLRATISI